MIKILTGITVCTFMRRVLERSYSENKNIILCLITSLLNCAVNEIMWQNLVEPEHNTAHGHCMLDN